MPTQENYENTFLLMVSFLIVIERIFFEVFGFWKFEQDFQTEACHTLLPLCEFSIERKDKLERLVIFRIIIRHCLIQKAQFLIQNY